MMEESQELPSVTQSECVNGAWNNITFPQISVRFRIVLASGTIIEGRQVANEPLSVFPMGDIVEYFVFIDEAPQGPRLVRNPG